MRVRASKRRMRILLCFVLGGAMYGQSLDVSKLEVRNGMAATTEYHGSQALQMTQKAGAATDSLAVLKGVTFGNGTIEAEMAGAPAKGSNEAARGFIGIAFHLQPDGSAYECFYLRPTNGRAADQLRRNHSTQYVSAPDWPWERLRKETPGLYESYVDLQPGEWTKVRIVVNGLDASLYVGGASEPCLLVHDLKLGAKDGGIALWIGPGTEGYFRNLKVSPGQGK
jgi:hypothetical protein